MMLSMTMPTPPAPSDPGRVTNYSPPRMISLGAAVAALIGVALAFAAVVGAIWLDERDQDKRDVQQEAADDQRALDVNYLSCLRGNELRQVQIDNEMEPSVPLDLTVLPSVQRAPQWFQDVTAELKALSAAAAAKPIDPESRTGHRIRRLQSQIRDCETEWAGHTADLRLPHDDDASLPPIVTTTTSDP